MNLAKTSIGRPVLTSMLSLALVLFGIIAATRLPVRELPDIDAPIVSVTTIYPGASASVVETEVTERLEEAINNIEGIRTLTSASREQASIITIEFNLSRQIDLAAQDVRDRVSRVRSRLPISVREPVVEKQDADAQPVLWIGLSSDRLTPIQLTFLAEKQIKNRFQTIKGVSSVQIAGEKRFAMRLWLNGQKMAAHRVTVLDVERALRQQNVELPSGRIENLDRELTIQTLGQLKTADDFNRLVLRTEGARVIRLQDVGEARTGVEEERTAARVGGKPCVFLGIIKQSKANTIEVADGIKAEMEAIRPSLPPSVIAGVNYDESVYVDHAIKEVWITLFIAFALVVIIIYLFLGDLRSTIVPAVAIPVSIIGTFLILQWLGYSINILTMLAFVLAIGVVVDDAVVVLENIFRHIEEGMAPKDASYKAMAEISSAIVAITISLVAVFLPLAFQKSATGQLFIEFAVSIAGSVVISAFVALSLTPMMAARILRPVSAAKHGPMLRVFNRGYLKLSRFYENALKWCLTHRWATVACASASMILMGWLFTRLDREFLPDEDKGRFFCAVIAPEGATAEYTDRMLKEMEKILGETPDIESYGSVLGFGGGGGSQANRGIVFVKLKDERKRSVQEIVNGPGGVRGRFFNEVEGAIAIPILPKAIGRGFGSPFELIVQSQDLEALDRYCASLAGKLRQSGYLQNVRVSYEVNKPELRLEIDRNRAAALGISVEDISRTLQVLFGGQDLSRIKQDGKEYLVIAQLERADRLVPDDIDRMYVRNARGELVQMGAVLKRTSSTAPNTIEHYNRLRSATISASPVGLPLGAAIARTETLLRGDLPDGFLFAWSGEARDLQESAGETLWILALALIIVYMTLASQFESLVHPFTVMLAVPLAGLGAFGLLWAVATLGKSGLIPAFPGMNINLFSQIGLVLLVGLVTKNSILLVEFANQEVAKGVAPTEAMIRAGVVRLRPILMTALCTVAGILPIAIGFGAGAESRRPMGLAVVGGMITSTVLTLVVVPVVYSLFGKFGNRTEPHVTTAPESVDH